MKRRRHLPGVHDRGTPFIGPERPLPCSQALQAAGALSSGRSTRKLGNDHLARTPTMVHGNVPEEPPAALRPLTVEPGSITSPGSNRMHCPPLGAPPIRPAGPMSEQ